MMLLSDAWLDGARVDARVREGRFTQVAPAGDLAPQPGEEVLAGGVLTPPTAEPHVHLDATQLGARAPNVSGTLREGIANWAQLREGLTAEDVLERARTTVGWYARHGTLRIRTHVDTGSRVAVEALLALRDELAPQGVELQVVAFPQEGIFRAPGRRAAWREAVALGCDAVGAIPHFERTTEEGWASVRLAFELAERYGRDVDFHCDETDDPGTRNLEVVCAETLDRRMGGHVVAGHCTALHSAPNPYAAKVIELVAEAGVLVVANPLDNTVLQGRYDNFPIRRGITRVRQLWDAGAQVGIGHDSVVDPWYRLGTANLVDAAHMLVHVAHLTGTAEMERVFTTLHTANHIPFGAVPRIEEGAVATFVWHDAPDPVDVLRLRRTPRVFVAGEAAHG